MAPFNIYIEINTDTANAGSGSGGGGGGTGTVTSVALASSGPSIYTVSGSPITTAGTITLSENLQASCTVFSGPVSGSNAAPTFRALTLADLPTGITATAVIPNPLTGTSIAVGSSGGTNYCQFVDVSDNSKIALLNLVGMTTATTGILAWSPSANRTLTLPDVTDTVVARTTTDTLTNKSLSVGSSAGTQFSKLVDVSDNSKRFLVDLNPMATGTTGILQCATSAGSQTFTLPQGTDTLVGTSLVQTLSNKVLLDTSTVIANTSTTTKQIKFSTSGASANTLLSINTNQTSNKTLSLTDLSANDNIALVAQNQTLTNKTLTQPILSNARFDGYRTALSKKVATYNLLTTDTTILCNAATSGFAINLVAIGSGNFVFNIKKTDASANVITIVPPSTTTIDGATTFFLTAQWQSVTLQCDNSTGYFII